MAHLLTSAELLDNASRLEDKELEQFVSKVLVLRAQRKGPALSRKEATLLKRINRSLPEAQLQRFQELLATRERRPLSDPEQQDLLALIEQIEQMDADRMKWLSELAEVRGLSLRAVMEQLGLLPVKNV